MGGTPGKLLCESMVEEFDESFTSYIVAKRIKPEYKDELCAKRCTWKSNLRNQIKEMTDSMTKTVKKAASGGKGRQQPIALFDQLKATVRQEWRLLLATTVCTIIISVYVSWKFI
eukprot:NODE_6044_length_473_cov_197.004717_g4553_i0.p1 GENE.NODE_6044_length_473_cov_197.004717_g4553_i0~~NODE_6044_length_473_cov_197.004717_g4553_i0.p1  ORF type:complete len:126 (+),score=27.37 NODE_6044_length_473_cov_197.004717_g4553_i0:34-378(+)